MLLLTNKRIFISEDNLQNRIIFQMALVRHGASVEFERWGRDTIHRLQNASQMDLVILDLNLAEGVSGFDLYQEIRELPRYDQTPVVAVSAMDASVAIPRARSLGFSGFIAKPIDNQLFGKQLATIMNGEEIWDYGRHTLA